MVQPPQPSQRKARAADAGHEPQAGKTGQEPQEPRKAGFQDRAMHYSIPTLARGASKGPAPTTPRPRGKPIDLLNCLSARPSGSVVDRSHSSIERNLEPFLNANLSNRPTIGSDSYPSVAEAFRLRRKSVQSN